MTNTNLQHDSGDQPLASGNQIVFMNGAQVMTFEADAMSATDDGPAKPQVIAWGPVAAQTPITPVGADSAYPSETPNAWSTLLECVNMLFFPIALVFKFGRMLRQMRQVEVISRVVHATRFGAHPVTPLCFARCHRPLLGS